MNSRKDKINFLTGLMRGNRTVSEIQYRKVTISIGHETETKYLDSRTGRELNRGEVSEWIAGIRKQEGLKFKIHFNDNESTKPER